MDFEILKQEDQNMRNQWKRRQNWYWLTIFTLCLFLLVKLQGHQVNENFFNILKAYKILKTEKENQDSIINKNKDLDNNKKILLSEESMRAPQNQEPCRHFPKLPLYSPEIMKFLKDEEPIECENWEEEDWVSCDFSICSIKEKIIAKKGLIECEFADIFRYKDSSYKTGKKTKTTKMYILKKSDFASVECEATNGDEWMGTVIGVRNDESILKRTSLSERSQLNVLMLGFDSMSRNAFMRKLPKSYKYLKKNLNGHVLEGYNIVGDATTKALIPILTGSTELELPETRIRKRNSTYVDVYPFIWKEYEKLGYVTSFNEDRPDLGTFTLRLNGFKKQPTDHYMRPYFLAVDSMLLNQQYCAGSQPLHRVFLDYTKAIMMHYSQPRFVFSFHVQLSHDSINMIGVADKDLLNWLKSLKYEGILNDTILILMSDHGNRFAEVRNTLQGKQEERLPFFSFTFPEWFKTEFQNEYSNFKKNLNRLTTPFDIHATLQHILYMQQNKSIPKPLHSRSISLFDEIPENRSCADAYIEPHWCSCLNWQPINGTHTKEVSRAAKTVLKLINKYTHPYRSLCEQLKLDKVLWAGKLEPQESLLHFNGSIDDDQFIPNLKSKMKIQNEMYQVKIMVQPSKAIYEASVTFNTKKNKFRVKLSDISRVNKYGSQPRCIYKVNPDLRKYCYCKKD